MKRIAFARKFQLILLVIVMCFFGCRQNRTAHRNAPGDAVPLMLKMADVRQANSYTCGVACALSILNYYGIDDREDRLASEFGSTEEAGTSPNALIKGFASHGLTTVLKEKTTLEDLRRNLEQNIPTMVAVQAWLDKYPPHDWSREWEAGHWLIVIGMDDQKIYFEDPSLLGVRGWMSQAEFLERWHDYIGKTPCCDETNHRYLQLSISVHGRPVNAPLYRHID